jgi:hypothetical protein
MVALDSPQAGLSSGRVDNELASATSTTANLTAACQGILDTSLAPSSSHWYPVLHADLQALREVAARWQTQQAGRLLTDVVTSVAVGARAFLGSRDSMDRLFADAEKDPGMARAALHAELVRLEEVVGAITRAAATYEEGLKRWGHGLQETHEKLSATIHQIQNEEAGLQGEIRGLNATMASMQAEIIRDRQEIAKAQRARDQGVVQTLFGVLFAPITGGLSLILAGIGVASIAEAEGKVKALEQLVANYQARIVAAQVNMSHDQAQVASLQALTLSAGIARSDSESAQKLLDSVRTSWEAFSQELAGVIRKIGKADSAPAMVVERAWWNATVREWELISHGVNLLLGAPRASVWVNRRTLGSLGTRPK